MPTYVPVPALAHATALPKESIKIIELLVLIYDLTELVAEGTLLHQPEP